MPYIPLNLITLNPIMRTHTPCRMILAIYLIMSRGLCWVLEQPSSSLVFRLPRFQELVRRATASWIRLCVCELLACNRCRSEHTCVYMFQGLQAGLLHGLLRVVISQANHCLEQFISDPPFLYRDLETPKTCSSCTVSGSLREQIWETVLPGEQESQEEPVLCMHTSRGFVV